MRPLVSPSVSGRKSACNNTRTVERIFVKFVSGAILYAQVMVLSDWLSRLRWLPWLPSLLRLSWSLSLPWLPGESAATQATVVKG
jgi:hypothetical protein